jgi:cytochrome c-type biogenesis protein
MGELPFQPEERMDRRELWGLVQDWSLAVFIAAGLMFGWNLLSPGPRSEGDAPALALPSTDGSHFDLADRTSAAYVVNFWATWCAPCRQEIPEFSRFSLEHPEVEVLGVSVDDAMATGRLAAEAKRLGITYRVLHDATGEVARAWGVSVYPTTFVLDRDLRIIGSRVGVMDRMGLEDLIPAAR